METRIIKVDKNNINPELLKEAGELLFNGELVAFPTETVYGLGANALDAEAVKKIFIAKGRPQDNPLIVHISDRDMLPKLVKEICPDAIKLMDAFWPGPLTILFPKSDIIPNQTTAGLDTVGIRMPEHPVALEMIRQAKVPIAAPSANTSTRPSPTLAQHVYDDMKGKIPLIIDGGDCRIGVESTVIRLGGDHPTILRPGGVTLEELRKVLPNTELYKIHSDTKMEAKPPTPGMKYRHYAPKIDTYVYVCLDKQKLVDTIKETAIKYIKEGKKVGIILCSDLEFDLKECNLVRIKGENKAAGLEHDLFYEMRRMESLVDVLLIEGVEEIKEGVAVMNRAKKAAVKTFDLN